MRKQNARMKAKHIDILCGIAALLAGALGVMVLHDGTALVAALFIAPVLFFRKHIYW